MSETGSGSAIAPGAWLVVGAATLGTVVYEFARLVIGVSLPYMQGSFSATPDQIAWVVTAYIIGTNSMVACVGWLSSRFGRRRLFLWSIFGFGAATLMCATAETLGQMIAWRFLQGLMGAPLVPLGQAICIDAFPPDKRDFATGIWGFGVVGGAIFGPVIGGVLIENWSWPWIFLVTLPVAVVAWLFAHACVPEVEENAPRPMDWPGFTALMVALVAFQIVLNRGQRLDWFESTEVVLASGLAVAALGFFLWWSARTTHPFLEPRVFRDRNFVIGTAFYFALGALLLLPLVLLPLLMQTLGGYPVVFTGALLMARGAAVMASMLVAAWMLTWLGARLVLGLGFACLIGSCWIMSGWTFDISPMAVIVVNVMQGIGSGITFVPITAIAFATLPDRLRTEAMSVYHLMFYLGGSIGVAAIFTYHQRSEQANHALINQHVTAFREQFIGLPASIWDITTASGLAGIHAEIARQASLIAYNNDFRIIAWIGIATLPLLALVRRRRVEAA